MRRGEIWWATLASPTGSEPGFRRPVLVVQSDDFNRSRIATIVVVALTSNLDLAAAPGNVMLRAKVTGLTKDSVANLSQVVTLDKNCLTERIGHLSQMWMTRIDAGLVLVLGLKRKSQSSDG